MDDQDDRPLVSVPFDDAAVLYQFGVQAAGPVFTFGELDCLGMLLMVQPPSMYYTEQSVELPPVIMTPPCAASLIANLFMGAERAGWGPKLRADVDQALADIRARPNPNDDNAGLIRTADNVCTKPSLKEGEHKRRCGCCIGYTRVYCTTCGCAVCPKCARRHGSPT
jgi:hypothetical protein